MIACSRARVGLDATCSVKDRTLQGIHARGGDDEVKRRTRGRLPLLQDRQRTDPAAIVYQDDRLVAFKDINPQAPMHVLVVPRRHIASLNDLTAEDDGLVGEMVRRGAALAANHGHGERGFRTVFNCNADAGQTVFHIHLHVLGGRTLTWPPG